MDYTPIVLKNTGVSAEFAKLKKVGDDEWERQYDENEELITETLFIRFTNNVIADIESHYGTLDAWQTALESQPATTLRQTLAFALKKPLLFVGEAMLDGESLGYSNIIGVAWAVANGVDPKVAGKMLSASMVLAKENKRQMQKAIEEQNQTMEDFPGVSGTQPGPKRTARTKSSGS